MKELSSSTENTTSNNSLFNRNSTVGVEQIFEWLDEQKSGVTPIKNSIIDSLKSSSIFEQMWVEELNEEENLIIVPLSSDFQSQHNAQYGPKNYLLFIEDGEGKIRKGNIIQYLPENGNAFPDLPVSSFHNLYNHEDLEVDGIYVFLSVGDKFQYEFKFIKGKLAQYSYLQQEMTRLFCSQWILITTTYYYIDGELVFTEQNIEDLGITCSSCPPNQWCDEIDNEIAGGSGPVPPVPDEVEETDYFLVAQQLPMGSYTNENWEVNQTIKLEGMRYLNSSMNYFTSNPINEGFNETSGINLGPCGLTTANCHAIWTPVEYFSNRSNNNKTGFVRVRGTITLPNSLDPYYNNPRLFTNTKNYNAAIVFP